MEVLEAIRTLLAVREYRDRPVPEEVIGRIVDAGRLTASASNRQPWHFIVVRDRKNLGQLGQIVTSGPYIAQAAVALVVVVNSTPTAVSDASRAIQSMLLATWAEGVGGNWTGFRGLDQVKTLLGIPENLDVVAVLPFGYPARSVGKGKKNRKPLSEVASSERYGQPMS